jgi:hypothetical protein
MVGAWCIGKDVEGSGRGLILRYYPGNLLEELWKTTQHNSKDSQFPGRDLNPGSPEYEAGVLTIYSQRVIMNILPTVNGKAFDSVV